MQIPYIDFLIRTWKKTYIDTRHTSKQNLQIEKPCDDTKYRRENGTSTSNSELLWNKRNLHLQVAIKQNKFICILLYIDGSIYCYIFHRTWILPLYQFRLIYYLIKILNWFFFLLCQDRNFFLEHNNANREQKITTSAS